MKESILRNRKVQFVFRLVTALSFTLFTAYQIFLAINIDTSRIGRLIGIGFYLLLIVASFLDFSEQYRVWIVHSVLLVAGLILLFGMRLLNAPDIFGYLNFANPVSVLYFAVYILSQLGTLVLVEGYLMLNDYMKRRKRRKLTVILMSVTIALYALCFIMECVLLLKYRMNIDLGLKSTLLSRGLYFLGFAGTAFCFMLPAPHKGSKVKEGEFVNSNGDDDKIDIII